MKLHMQIVAGQFYINAVTVALTYISDNCGGEASELFLTITEFHYYYSYYY